MPPNKCPGCGALWESNARGGCAMCGWEKREHRDGRIESPHDGKCHMWYDGRQCPFPGNIEDGGKCYCRHHYKPDNRGNGPDQYEWFRVFDRTTEHGRNCIREQMAGWYGGTTKHLARDLAKKHPEWFRQPDEAESAYAARMIALCKRLERGMMGGRSDEILTRGQNRSY